MIRRCVYVLICLLVTVPLAAQTDRASVNGTITDPSGALVGRANVRAESIDTGFRRGAVTGDTGTYQLTGLPIGAYRITVEHEGFKTVTFDQVVLSVGETRTLDARLDIGSV